LGFEQIFISKYNQKGLAKKNYGIKIATLGKIEDLIQDIFT